MEYRIVFMMVISFLVGSIPWGWIISHRKGINIRAVGSGNIGATNVSRALGMGWGLIVFVLDFAKGLLPVLTGRAMYPDHAGTAAWIGVFAVMGHMFTPWLRFRGGKGVATAFGVFIGISPWAAISAFGIFLLVLAWSSYVALGSLLGAVSFMLVISWLSSPSPKVLTAAALTVLLIILRHKDNILRLMNGSEPRIRWDKGDSLEQP